MIKATDLKMNGLAVIIVVLEFIIIECFIFSTLEIIYLR